MFPQARTGEARMGAEARAGGPEIRGTTPRIAGQVQGPRVSGALYRAPPGLVPQFAEGEHYNNIPLGAARRAVPKLRRYLKRARTGRRPVQERRRLEGKSRSKIRLWLALLFDEAHRPFLYLW